MENAGRLRNGRAPKRPTIENDHPTSSLDNDKSRHPDSTTHIRNTPLYIYIHTHTHTYTYLVSKGSKDSSDFFFLIPKDNCLSRSSGIQR